MKYLIRATMLLACFAFFGAAAADDPLPPSPVSPPGAQTDGPKERSETLLYPERGLREQIERTKAFLDDKESEVDDEIDRLKTEGVLDRRSTSSIRTALDDARGSMTGMVEGVQGGLQVDGTTARMIAYELGMAADTLAHHAYKIEAKVNGAAEDGAQAPDGQPVELDQRRRLAEVLKTTGTLLRKTAQAIVRNLR